MIGNARQPRVGAHLRRHLVAVHARHFDVEQDDVGRVLLEHLHGIDAVARGEHAHAVALEQALGHAAHGDRVVDHQCDDCACPSSRAA